MSEFVTLVDANDTVIGECEKIEAHENALLHRAFSVFIIKQTYEGVEILLQRRNRIKYHCGGLWTNTCCGHPRPSETVSNGAHRRLIEEMGIVIDLTFIDKFQYRADFENGLTENEIDHVFYARYNNETIEINPDEVSEHAWVNLNELKKDIVEQPERFTPWLLPALAVLESGI